MNSDVCEIEELKPEKKSEKGLQKLKMYPKQRPYPVPAKDKDLTAEATSRVWYLTKNSSPAERLGDHLNTPS
jgi:hypothetical protein